MERDRKNKKAILHRRSWSRRLGASSWRAWDREPIVGVRVSVALSNIIYLLMCTTAFVGLLAMLCHGVLIE